MSDAHHEEITKLEALYDEHPEGRIFTHLAEAYRKAGRLERAHEVLLDGIRRHPDYSSAHVVLGRVLLDQGRSADAAGEFRRVLELDPNNLVATRSLGDIAHADGDHATALEYYEQLLSQDPSSEVKEMVEELSEAGGPGGEAATGTSEDMAAPESDAAGAGLETEDWGFEDIGAIDELGTQPGAGLWGGESTEEAGGDSPSAAWSEDEPEASDEEAEEDAEAEGTGPWDDEIVTGFDAPLTEEDAVTGPGSAGGLDPEPLDDERADASGLEPVGEPADDPAGELDAEPVGGLGVEPIDEPVAELEDEPGSEPVGELGAAPVEEAGPEEPGEPEVPEEPVDGGWPVRASAGDDDVVGDDGDDWTDADESAEAPAGEFASGEQEVRTETLAWIYARQGLYDRAAGVYRELLRTRPDDEDLKERLSEMEEAARAQRASPDMDEPEEAEEVVAPDDLTTWQEPGQVAHAEVDERDPETGLITSVEDAETALLGEGVERENMLTPAEDDASPPIRQYFDRLLGWPEETEDAPAGDTGDGMGEEAGTDEPTGQDEPAGSAVEAASEGDPVGGENVGDPETDPASRSGDGDNDDDDLEMFRSWLESLKQ